MRNLGKIKDEKQKQIDDFVRHKKPQYRYLLNYRKDVYDKIPVGLSEERLDLELYKQEQQWEYDIAQQKVKIEEKQKESAANTPQFMELFKEYCSSVTQLSQASLAEYIVRRKAVIELWKRHWNPQMMESIVENHKYILLFARCKSHRMMSNLMR